MLYEYKVYVGEYNIDIIEDNKKINKELNELAQMGFKIIGCESIGTGYIIWTLERMFVSKINTIPQPLIKKESG